MLGLFAFFYATLHMLTWVVFIHYFDVTFMIEDVVKRPFITVGMTTFLILLVLALTSNRVLDPQARSQVGQAPSSGVRGRDRRHAALLAAGEGRHHRALAMGRGLRGAVRDSCVVGLSTSPCATSMPNAQRPTPNYSQLPTSKNSQS